MWTASSRWTGGVGGATFGSEPGVAERRQRGQDGRDDREEDERGEGARDEWERHPDREGPGVGLGMASAPFSGVCGQLLDGLADRGAVAFGHREGVGHHGRASAQYLGQRGERVGERRTTLDSVADLVDLIA